MPIALISQNCYEDWMRYLIGNKETLDMFPDKAEGVPA
jgi:hypothetical protein